MSIIDDLQKSNEELKRKVKEISDTVSNIRGKPIIQGYGTKRLDLNESVDTVNLLKKISELETRVHNLELPL